MMMNKVVTVAMSQIGVHESPSGSNNVKYNTWFYGKPVSGTNYSWCATFLDWCFEQAGMGKLYPHNANAAYGQDEIVSKCNGHWILKQNKNLAKRKEYVRKNARSGDIVDFNFNGLSEYRQHTGIVERVEGDYLVTIEGNTSNGNGSQSNGGIVARRKRHYKYVISAVRPAWGKIEKTETKKVKTKTKKVKTETKKSAIPSYTVGKTYTVAVDCLNVRTGAGVKYDVKSKGQLTKDGQRNSNGKGQLMKGTRVTVQKVNKNNGNVWIKIPSGWICAYYNGKKYVG